MITIKIEKCIKGPLEESLNDEKLYKYYLDNIYNGNLEINGTKIDYFTTPVEDNHMQGFFHITTKTQYKFGIKIRLKEKRAYYINLIPLMINNYRKCKTCENIECDKIKIWTSKYKDTKRTKLLYSDEDFSYIIILERKKDKLYLISAYLIDEPGYLQKVLKEYNKNKKNS